MEEVVLKMPTIVGVSVVVAGVSMGRAAAAAAVGPHVGYPFDEEEDVDEDLPELLDPWGCVDDVDRAGGEDVETAGAAGSPLVREDAGAREERRAMRRQIVHDAVMANELEEEQELEAMRGHRRAHGSRRHRCQGRRNLRRLLSGNSVSRCNTRRHPQELLFPGKVGYLRGYDGVPRETRRLV